MSKLLIDEAPHQVIPSLAKAIGLNQAIALQQLHFRLQVSEYKKSGKVWLPRSMEDWQKKEFIYWSVPTVDRVFDRLEQGTLIERTDMWNNKGGDRTLWYTILYEQVDQLAQYIDQMKATGAWEAVDQDDQLYKEEKEEESLILFSFTSSVVQYFGFFTPDRVRELFGPSESLPNGKNATTVWETTFGQLSLSLPREAFDTWLRGVVLIHQAGGVFTFDAKNIYAQDWLTNHPLSKAIVRTLKQVAGCDAEVRFVLASEFVESEKTS